MGLMIGHVFSSSGAICLATAPHVDRDDEYVVLARYDAGYAVASLRISAMPAPASWSHGAYFDDVDQAVDAFLEDTGLPRSVTSMRRSVEIAEASCLSSVTTMESAPAASGSHSCEPASDEGAIDTHVGQ
jgi:hypothetical protein